jgi:hypothetical protein
MFALFPLFFTPEWPYHGIALTAHIGPFGVRPRRV